jgi:hypothetical protein
MDGAVEMAPLGIFCGLTGLTIKERFFNKYLFMYLFICINICICICICIYIFFFFFMLGSGVNTHAVIRH